MPLEFSFLDLGELQRGPLTREEGPSSSGPERVSPLWVSALRGSPTRSRPTFTLWTRACGTAKRLTPGRFHPPHSSQPGPLVPQARGRRRPRAVREGPTLGAPGSRREWLIVFTTSSNRGFPLSLLAPAITAALTDVVPGEISASSGSKVREDANESRRGFYPLRTTPNSTGPFGVSDLRSSSSESEGSRGHQRPLPRVGTEGNLRVIRVLLAGKTRVRRRLQRKSQQTPQT